MRKSEKRPLIRKHIGLKELLQLATPDELVSIAEILLDKTNDRLLGDDSARLRLAQHFKNGELYKAVDDIDFEIRALGSVSLASKLRGGEPVSYDEVVRDVSSELKVEFRKSDSTSTIEEKLLAKLGTDIDGGSPLHAALGYGVIAALSPMVNVRGAVVAAGVLAPTPLAIIGAVGAGAWVYNNKKRKELQGLTMIVAHIARIRAWVVAEDSEDFINRLWACL